MVKNDTSFEDVKKFINNLAYLYQVSSEVEQWIDNPLVSGSIPLPGTIVKCIAEQTNGGEPMSSVLHYGNLGD